MKDIIIIYPEKEVALKLRAFLECEGYHVSHVCGTGAAALGIAQQKHDGVIVCASHIKDMSAATLANNLPINFDVIALTKNGRETYADNYVSLTLPLNRREFLKTVAVFVSSKSSFTRRTEEDTNSIENAKLLLIEVWEMTELQAHRYLQKESMRTGLQIADIAKKIISEFT